MRSPVTSGLRVKTVSSVLLVRPRGMSPVFVRMRSRRVSPVLNRVMPASKARHLPLVDITILSVITGLRVTAVELLHVLPYLQNSVLEMNFLLLSLLPALYLI